MLCKKEKNILYTKLSQNKSTLLEDKFNELIENNWQSFLSNLQGKIDGTTFNFIYLTNEELSLLKLTVLTMLLRIENTPGIPGRHYAIEKSLSKLSSLMPSVEKKNQFNNLVKNLNVSNLKFLKDIYDLLFNEDNFTLKKVMFEQYKLNFEFFVIKNNDYEFLTSDVPCFEVFNNFEATNLNNGIYFPLSPKILTILRIDDQPNNFINVFEVKEDRIKYFNWLIYNNCQQYVIFKSKLVFK